MQPPPGQTIAKTPLKALQHLLHTRPQNRPGANTIFGRHEIQGGNTGARLTFKSLVGSNRGLRASRKASSTTLSLLMVTLVLGQTAHSSSVASIATPHFFCMSTRRSEKEVGSLQSIKQERGKHIRSTHMQGDSKHTVLQYSLPWQQQPFAPLRRQSQMQAARMGCCSTEP